MHGPPSVLADELSDTAEMLEVGFGSGLNVPHYPPAVTEVRAVDPAIVGRKLAAKRVASSSVPVQYVDLDGQALSQESASVHHVLTTWTLCTIPDVNRALSEIRRVLRPCSTSSSTAAHPTAKSPPGRTG